jgi:hypothetical protein
MGGQDQAAPFVAPADDLEEEVGGAGLVGQVPDLVDDEQAAGRVVVEPPAEGAGRLLAADNPAAHPTTTWGGPSTPNMLSAAATGDPRWADEASVRRSSAGDATAPSSAGFPRGPGSQFSAIDVRRYHSRS